MVSTGERIITSISPWHKIVTLRPDLKSGELSLAVFAADLYDVINPKGTCAMHNNSANDYLEHRALRRNQLFHQLLQALIELSTGGEHSLLESISNHVGAGGKQAFERNLL